MKDIKGKIGKHDIALNGPAILSAVRGLCPGMEMGTCLLAAFLIPFLTKHPKIYG
jgi:hypothetical protein